MITRNIFEASEAKNHLEVRVQTRGLIVTSLSLVLLHLALTSPQAIAENVKSPRRNESLNYLIDHSNPADLEISAYLLGPGDVLELKLFDAPELSGEITILNDGSMSIPLVGHIVIEGLSLQQAAEQIKLLLSKELLRPELQLRILKQRPIRVSVLGAVEMPGLYTLTNRESTQTEGGVVTEIGRALTTFQSALPTVVDAIQKAGGITPQANLKNVQLQRLLPGRPRRYKLTNLNLLDLVLHGDQDQNPYLFDGDTIKLIQAEETPSEAIELAATNLSPQVINVNIIGEVNDPGILQIPAQTPLVQAILAAGGLKDWRANGGNVELVRINRNGSAALSRFRFEIDGDTSNKMNPPLRNGDTIRVKRSLFAKGSDAISAVSKPVSNLVTVLSLFRLIQSTD